MTAANKVTILRVILIPIMIIFIYIDSLKKPIGFLEMDINHFIFAVLFIVASLTDMLDGYLARKRNEITTFGKFLDPIADKLLVLTALIYLLNINPQHVPVWAVVIVIFREFLVTGVRLLAVEKGEVIAASLIGKLKTVFTLIAIIMMLFNDFGIPKLFTVGDFNVMLSDFVFWIALVLTVYGGLDYLIKNRKVVFESI